MKHSIMKFFFLLLLFSILILIPLNIPYPTSSVSAASRILLFEEDISLMIGEEYQLIPLSLTLDLPRFKSSNSKIASVNALGQVVAKKPGTATITISIGKEKTTCHVTVRETIITLNKQKVSLQNGETYKLSATTSDGTYVTYKSSKKSVAVIDDTGTITALKPGASTITVSANGTKSLCTVIVRKPSVKLDKTSLTLFRGQTFTLTPTISSRIQPIYKTNKKSVAVVDSSGTITAVKHGSATITATVDGVSATCVVTVKQPEISLSHSEIQLKTGESKAIHATVSSGNIPLFTTSNSNVITVSTDGKITALKKGTAYLYCSEDGIKVKCKVLVTE